MLENPDMPTAKKVLFVAAVSFAVLATGYFVGLLGAGVAACFLGIVVGSVRVIRDLKKENASLKIDVMMGSAPARIDEFPTLDLGERESETGEINFIRSDEAQGPRKGVDKYGRRFYAFTVERRGNAPLTNPPPSHVVVVYQKYLSGDVWAVSGPEGLAVGELTWEGRDKITKILRRTDADFEILVNWSAVDGYHSAQNT